MFRTVTSDVTGKIVSVSEFVPEYFRFSVRNFGCYGNLNVSDRYRKSHPRLRLALR